jgi:hypothetical protein
METGITIYKSHFGDCFINFFYGRKEVGRDEVIIKMKMVFGKEYTYAEPSTPGNYAFGGNILYTSNGIYPDFCKTPIKLHDRQMNLENYTCVFIPNKEKEFYSLYGR